jgi:regulator of protease activity HflC (stomatin/prohibitin superfamily)
MLGFKYIKFDAMTHVIHHQNGKIKNQGKGLSFFYFKPSSSITAIPMSSNDLPFIFNEITSDYQTITVQGQITYRITDPQKLSESLDYTVNDKGQYKKDDAEKLSQRIINEAQSGTTSLIQAFNLKESLRATKEIEQKIKEGLAGSDTLSLLGVEIMSVNILAIKATPEMGRALETETREKLQQEADQAIYERRNFAVEQERRIKESELNTEIAVEEKQKQIIEKRMESKVVETENNRKIREMNIKADISVEEERQKLIDLKVENERKEADAKSYDIASQIKPYKDLDWKTIMALSGNTGAKDNIAIAFRELAENAQKIGTLNITPDLLQNMTEQQQQH